MKTQTNEIKLPRGIWALGLVSLFMDTSSELVHGILPVFLVSVLGASMTSVGALEGMAEASTLIVKVFSGPLSDWLERRKPLVVLGYAMGALSKPLFALSGTVLVVFGARLFDRIGKGIRGAPRDALVADIAPPELRGRAFGLRQSLDTVGAFLGPVLAIVLMALTHNDYRLVFWLATIPGLLSVSVLLFGVHEEGRSHKETARRLSFSELKEFSTSFWVVAGFGSLFQLARFSEAFLILRAKALGLPLELAPLVLIVMNIIYALSSYPAGNLSDRIPRAWLLILGVLILAISDLILGLSGSLYGTLFGVALWGLHMGLTQGILAALVADTCSPELRGTAYGIFNLFSAGALLFASLVAGILWDLFGSRVTFFSGAGFSIVTLFALLSTKSIWGKHRGLAERNSDLFVSKDASGK